MQVGKVDALQGIEGGVECENIQICLRTSKNKRKT